MLSQAKWRRVFYFRSLPSASSCKGTQLWQTSSVIGHQSHCPIPAGLTASSQSVLNGCNISRHLRASRKSLISNSKGPQLGKWVGATDRAQVLFSACVVARSPVSGRCLCRLGSGPLVSLLQQSFHHTLPRPREKTRRFREGGVHSQENR